MIFSLESVHSSSYDYRSCVLLCSEIFRISSKLCFVFLYWLGVWGVGVATSAVRLDHVPLGNDQSSWVLTSDGTTVHNNEVISRLKEKPSEGDIIVRCENIIT